MEKIIQAHNLFFELYLSEAQIHTRVQALGEQLQATYRDKYPLFLGVLNGAFIFTSDLVRAFDAPCEIAFIKVASYDGTTSTGDLKTLIGLTTSLTNRHVVIVEDIVDTGNTMARLLPDLAKQHPASIALCSLLLKREALLHQHLPLDYIGFEIPNKFVIGYGLDYNEAGRYLSAIYQLKEGMIE